MAWPREGATGDAENEKTRSPRKGKRARVQGGPAGAASWSLRPGSRGLDADRFEASSGLRGRSFRPVAVAASFPGGAQWIAAENPEYSSASATDSHRLPFLEGSSRRIAGWVARGAGGVKGGRCRDGVFKKSQGPGGWVRGPGKKGERACEGGASLVWWRLHQDLQSPFEPRHCCRKGLSRPGSEGT